MRLSACADCAFRVRLIVSPGFAWPGPCQDSTTAPGGWGAGGTSLRWAAGPVRATDVAAAEVLTATVPSGFMLNRELRRLASVPDQYSTSLASGTRALPTMCGVMASTIS